MNLFWIVFLSILIGTLYISTVIANNDYRLKYWLLSLIGLPIIILLTPFWTIIAEKFNDMGIDDYKRKTFTIHKLTRENKIALLGLKKLYDKIKKERN